MNLRYLSPEHLVFSTTTWLIIALTQFTKIPVICMYESVHALSQMQSIFHEMKRRKRDTTRNISCFIAEIQMTFLRVCVAGWSREGPGEYILLAPSVQTHVWAAWWGSAAQQGMDSDIKH